MIQWLSCVRSRGQDELERSAHASLVHLRKLSLQVRQLVCRQRVVHEARETCCSLNLHDKYLRTTCTTCLQVAILNDVLNSFQNLLCIHPLHNVPTGGRSNSCLSICTSRLMVQIAPAAHTAVTEPCVTPRAAVAAICFITMLRRRWKARSTATKRSCLLVWDMCAKSNIAIDVV